MERRKFLATAMLATIAGCSGDDTEEMDDQADDDTTQTETTAEGEDETETEDETATTEDDEDDESDSSGEPSLEITDHELVVEEGDYTTDAYVAATVENTGDAPSGPVELIVDWYDGDENYVDNDSWYLQSLGAGETWAARVYFLGTGAEDIESYEIEGEFDTESPSFDPEGLNLVSHEMKVGDDEAVIEGEIENETGSDVSYVEVIGKVYDADGVVLGDEWTNVSDLPAGETWTFDLSWRGRDRLDQADGYELLVTDSTF